MQTRPDFLDGLNTENAGGEEEREEAVTIEEETEEEEVESEEEAEETEAPGDKQPTAPPAEDAKEKGTKAGMLAERRKRQEAEARIAELQRKLEEHSKPKATEAPKPEPVEFFKDPQKYVDQAAREAEQRATARHLAALEADFKEDHPDFDETVAPVLEAAKTNPAIRDQVFQAANPAKALYKLGQKTQEMEKMKDPDAYRAQLRDELKAELLKELRGELQDGKRERQAAKAAAIPPELSNGRGGKESAEPAQDPRKGDFVDLFKTG